MLVNAADIGIYHDEYVRINLLQSPFDFGHIFKSALGPGVLMSTRLVKDISSKSRLEGAGWLRIYHHLIPWSLESAYYFPGGLKIPRSDTFKQPGSCEELVQREVLGPCNRYPMFHR